MDRIVVLDLTRRTKVHGPPAALAAAMLALRTAEAAWCDLQSTATETERLVRLDAMAAARLGHDRAEREWSEARERRRE